MKRCDNNTVENIIRVIRESPEEIAFSDALSTLELAERIQYALEQVQENKVIVAGEEPETILPDEGFSSMASVTVSGGSGGGEDENAVHYTPDTDKTDDEKAQARSNIGAGTYTKPSGGIPSSDLTNAVQTNLGLAATAVQPTTLIQYRTAGLQDIIDAGKQNVISDLATIRSNAALGASAIQAGDDISALENDAGYLTLETLPIWDGGSH